MVEKINRLTSYLLKVFVSAVILACLVYKEAKSNSITLISDEETQSYLAEVLKPLFNAANLNFDKNKLFIVNDNSLNAFVSDGNYMFVHTGTLMSIDNTNELAGILAHETGHITGGHIVRQKLKMEKMQYVMLGSMIVAGAAAASSGRGDAAMAVILGAQSSAINSIMNYQIQEERSADESAIKLLNATKQSTNGLKKFMKKINKQNVLGGIEETSYFRTHPLTNERIQHFSEASKNNSYSEKSPLDNKLKMIQAKLSAFLDDTDKVWKIYPLNNKSPHSKYAQSILFFREGKLKEALNELNNLIQFDNSNPYFYELKGQMLFESGQLAESIKSYDKALRMLPNSPLIQTSLAHALIEYNHTNNDVKKAIKLLNKSNIKNETPNNWQLLAKAYSLDNNMAYSYFSAAEFNRLIGNFDTAKKQIEKAKKLVKDKSLQLKISDFDEKIKSNIEKQQ